LALDLSAPHCDDRHADAGAAQIALIYAAGVFGMLVVSIAVPTLGGIGAEFRVGSAAALGWVMSMPAIAAVLGSLAVGALVDRLGDRPVMLTGALLVIASDGLVVGTVAFPVLLAARALGGLGYVGMVVGAVAMIGRMTHGRRRELALALWSTVIPASFVAAGLYGVTAGARGLGWRTAYIGHGAVLALLIALIAALLPPRAGPPRGTRLAGLGRVLGRAGPWQLGLSFAGAAFLQTGFVAWLPTLLATRLGVGEAVIHAFTLPAMACNIAGAFSLGALHAPGVRGDRLGLGATALVVAAAAGLVAAPVTPAMALTLYCALMLGLGVLVGMWALLPLVTPDPQSYGATSGMITQITLLGVLFGPPPPSRCMPRARWDRRRSSPPAPHWRCSACPSGPCARPIDPSPHGRSTPSLPNPAVPAHAGYGVGIDLTWDIAVIRGDLRQRRILLEAVIPTPIERRMQNGQLWWKDDRTSANRADGSCEAQRQPTCSPYDLQSKIPKRVGGPAAGRRPRRGRSPQALGSARAFRPRFLHPAGSVRQLE
jgi:MFS transporter, DHA1 family, inner membrane transport protein